MLEIGPIAFETSDCSALEPGIWLAPQNVAISMRAWSGRPAWALDAIDLAAATVHFGDECRANSGAMLSLDVTRAGSLEALRGFFKYRSPWGSFAMLYVGILWVPLKERLLQVNVEAYEQGTTGLREATVYACTAGAGFEVEASTELPTRAPDDPIPSAPPPRLPSDDESWDHLFPGHPLTAVRTRLALIERTLAIGSDLRTRRGGQTLFDWLRAIWRSVRPNAPASYAPTAPSAIDASPESR